MLLATALGPWPAWPAQQPVPIVHPTDAFSPPAEVAPPPSSGSPRIDLGRAVSLTVTHDPRLQAEKQEVALALGTFEEASGLFDQLLLVGPSYSYTQNEISEFLKNREFGKRELLARLAAVFRDITQVLREARDQNELTPPPCPEGVQFVGFGGSPLERQDSLGRAGLLFEDTLILLPLDISRATNDFLQICSPRSELAARAESNFEVIDTVNRAFGLGLENLLATSSQLSREILSLSTDIADAVATKSQLAVERLGLSPEDEITKTLTLDFKYLKPFRTGIHFSGNLRLKSTERNFKGRPLDPAFGGLGLRNDFPSFASASFQIPLGRGRGRVSAGAPENAAELAVEARREQLRHAVSEEVFSTVLAYLNLVAAQDSLRLIEESAERQQRLADLTGELIGAGELPGTDLDRARARAATVSSLAASGRLAVLSARLSLAQTVGLRVEGLDDAPLAVEGFPVSLDPRPAGAAPSAVRRRDLKAAARLREASSVLAGAARADLKRTLDLSITGGMSTFYESPLFKFFPEELDLEDRRPDSPVDYHSPRGFWRSFEGNWTPFIMAGLTIDLPFKNNVARGRLLQEQSSLTMSEIELLNLERIIEENIIEVRGAVERAAEVLVRRQETVGHYEQTLAAALARFQAGDINLVDMLVTEEELTREKVERIRSVQVYLSLLARLKFETGELVRFRNEGSRSEAVEFDAFDLVGR